MTPQQIGEIDRILDDLAALSVRLKCYGDHPPDTLILPAGKVVDACAAIDDAVSAARRLMDLERHTQLLENPSSANDDAGDVT